jgi:hypothetical protein
MNGILAQPNNIQKNVITKKQTKKQTNLVPSFIIVSFTISLNIIFMIAPIRT